MNDTFSDNTQDRVQISQTQELFNTFKLTWEASAKVSQLITDMGLTIDDVKEMSLEEIQMRHEAYLLAKDRERADVEQEDRFEGMRASMAAYDEGQRERQESLLERWRASHPTRATAPKHDSEHLHAAIEEGKKDPKRWQSLMDDLAILEAKEERQKKQEEMAYVRENVPENYANRAERRRILRANKKGRR